MTHPTDFRFLCSRLHELLEDIAKTHQGLDDSELSTLLHLRGMTLKALAAPQQGAPSDQDLRELAWKLQAEAKDSETCGDVVVQFARAVLTRYGAQAVPVAERLPGEGDCAPWPDDSCATHWCWAGREVDGGWEWAQISMFGIGSDYLGRIIAGGGWTHWLPHWALPLPEAQP